MDYRSLRTLIESFLLEKNLNTLNRTYGVEFEMCFNKIKLKEYISTHQELFPTIWSHDDFLFGSQNVWNEILNAEGFEGWDAHGDGSVRGEYNQELRTTDLGTEIVTPILFGEEGLYEIMRFLDFATKKLGGYVNESCGGHIHIGAKDLIEGNQKQIANKVIVGLLTAHKFTPLLKALVPEERRETQYARPVEVDTYDAEEQLSISDENKIPTSDDIYYLIDTFAGNRYKMINFRPLIDKGTIEFRIFDGSLDYKTIEERIRFGNAFVNALNETEIDLTKNIKTLKDRLEPHLKKGPRTQNTKTVLRNILLRNIQEQKGILESISTGLRYTMHMQGASNVGVDLMQAIIKYPLYRKPVNLLEHHIMIDFRTSKNVDKAKEVLAEAGLYTYNTDKSSVTFNETTMVLEPIVKKYQTDYKKFLNRELSTLGSRDELINKGMTPEEFLAKLDVKEAEPYRVSLEKYNKELENPNSNRLENMNDEY